MPLDLSTLPTEEIRAFCERHCVARMSIVGSALREDCGPGSDIDVLVELIPARAPGLRFVAMQDESSALLGRRVDLLTPGFLSDAIRDRVKKRPERVYDAA